MPKLAEPVAWTPSLLSDPTAHWRYIADPHFDHNNIRIFCDRPFATVADMNIALLTALRAAEAESPNVRLVFAGDVSFNLPAFVERYGWLAHPTRHVCVGGNHDRMLRYADVYAACFGVVIGSEKSWSSHSLLIDDTMDGAAPAAPVRVLVSHNPLRQLHGAQWNVYGHYHDNLMANPGGHDLKALGWLLDSSRHLNAGVELLSYRPHSLASLTGMQGASTLRSRIPDLNARRDRKSP